MRQAAEFGRVLSPDRRAAILFRLADLLEKSAEEAKEALKGTTEAHLKTHWKLLAGEWIFNYEQEQKLRKRQRPITVETVPVAAVQPAGGTLSGATDHA